MGSDERRERHRLSRDDLEAFALEWQRRLAVLRDGGEPRSLRHATRGDALDDWHRGTPVVARLHRDEIARIAAVDAELVAASGAVDLRSLAVLADRREPVR
jgi:hypothetical protein